MSTGSRSQGKDHRRRSQVGGWELGSEQWANVQSLVNNSWRSKGCDVKELMRKLWIPSYSF